MSTKINVRSPYYLSYSEPTKPLPLFTSSFANPQGFAVDDSGVISLPILDFGEITGYTSTASDFTKDNFGEVSSDTVRTITLTILVPEGFSNVGEAIQVDVSATQPLKVASCNTIVSGTALADQTLAAGGASVTLNYSSNFSGTTSSFTDLANNPSELDISLDAANTQITITSKNLPGVYFVFVRRLDNSSGCVDFADIKVTVSAPTVTFDCTTANLLGGAIAADGTLTTPLAVGEITATKETSGGATVTSVAANSSGAAISKTLFYDITVPAGFSNTGATVECSKAYTQNSTAVTPTFSCNDVDFDDQAILVDGNVTAGVAKWHQAPQGKSDANYFLTITGFTPTTFPVVQSLTRRDVDYTITVPPGFTNSGNSLTCSERVKQPASDVPINPCDLKTHTFYVGVNVVNGAAPFNYDVFQEKNLNSVFWEVKAAVSDYGSLAGETLCNAANNRLYTGGRNGGFIYVNKIQRPSDSNQQEYVLVFGSNNIINSVYLKDWNTKQVRKIG
tara:strand:- start:4122 stop:5642 length:1521 start_codon:yes stop_codon:yes gene_type:complete